MAGRLVIGVDLGGTNLRTALLDRDGRILGKSKEATHASQGRDKVVTRLIENIRAIRDRGGSTGRDLIAVGVGAPGVIHAEKGIVVKSPNFPDWNYFPLRSEIEAVLGIPVVVENDANAAALGEQWLGAGRGVRSMLFITLGTGVGGGIILDNRIWHGADGMAGEVGHITLVPDGRKCGCGNTGCLETYASAPGIVKSYWESLGKSGEDTAGREITSQEIYQAARNGDRLSIHVMREMGRYLGMGIANLINIFNPEMIVIGGGVMEAWPLFIDYTREEIRRRAFEYPAERTRIVQSLLGDDAGVVGAAAAALQRAAAAGQEPVENKQ